MGKAIVNISESSRTQEKGFSEIIPSTSIGPEPDKIVSGENISIVPAESTTINTWKVMTTGDAGLKDALYNFINTSKEGVSVAPNLILGREKKMTFDFFGSMGKSIMPGEIGQFEVVFSYHPNASQAATTITTE